MVYKAATLYFLASSVVQFVLSVLYVCRGGGGGGEKVSSLVWLKYLLPDSMLSLHHRMGA